MSPAQPIWTAVDDLIKSGEWKHGKDPSEYIAAGKKFRIEVNDASKGAEDVVIRKGKRDFVASRFTDIERQLISSWPGLTEEKLIAPTDQQNEAQQHMVILASEASQGPPLAPPAEASIPGDEEAVKSLLIRVHAADSWAVLAETQHQITFAKSADVQFNFLNAFLFGNYAARAYRVIIQYTFTKDGPDATHVNTFEQADVQNGFGRVQSYNITDNPDVRRMMQAILDKAKSEAAATAPVR